VNELDIFSGVQSQVVDKGSQFVGYVVAAFFLITFQ